MDVTNEPHEPTESISDSTVEQYQIVAKRLVRRARAGSENRHGPFPLTGVVKFLQTIIPTIKPRTFRFYRASLAYHLKSLGTKGDASKALAMLRRLSSEKVGTAVKGRRTSSQKSKHLSSEDMRAIIKALSGPKTNTAQLTLMWLLASRMTGLRPQEWCGAKLISTTGVPVLEVLNLKTTQGRSFGKMRSIELLGIDKTRLAAIETHLSLFRDSCLEHGSFRVERAKSDTDPMYQQKCIDAGFKTVYTKCRQFLYKTVRKIFKRRKLHITLYSGRHQFAANAKKSFDKGTVAALLGHGSLATAGRFYGLSARGSAIKVKPSAETRLAVLSKNAAKGMSADIVYRPAVSKKDPRPPRSPRP